MVCGWPGDRVLDETAENADLFDLDHPMETQRKIGPVGALDREVVDQRWLVAVNPRIAGHEEIDDDFDRLATVRGGDSAHELKPSPVFALLITLAHQRADQRGVLTTAERFCIKAQVHVDRPDVRHVRFVEQNPRNRPSHDRELSPEASEDLTDLDQYRLHRCRGAVVIVVRGLRLSVRCRRH